MGTQCIQSLETRYMYRKIESVVCTNMHKCTRAFWCSVSGNKGTTMVSDVGPGWYFLHTIPSTVSSCDQSWAYLLSCGCFQFLCGKCCSEWSALYSCWIVLSCCCACLISSAVKPACTVVKAAWRVSISGPLLHNSVSAFPLVVPFLYMFHFCSPSHCRGHGLSLVGRGVSTGSDGTVSWPIQLLNTHAGSCCSWPLLW